MTMRLKSQAAFKPNLWLNNNRKLALLAFLLTTTINTWATEAQTVAVDLPAQSLAAILSSLARMSNVKLIYADSLVQGLQAEALKGNFTIQQALAKVLSKTGLQVDSVGDSLVIVKADETTALPKVKVIANAVYDIKDPYNEDYVLPNSRAGTKTDTPIMETPLNVQVISKQVLKDQQVITLTDALKNVSGVTFDSTTDNLGAGTSQEITLRGFASQTYFRNGFRLQQGAGQREMANVENIEVLKGSAAILCGLVEPGGMVNVITKQPLSTPYYAAQQQFGSYGLYRTTLDATGPVADNKDLLYRMNMSYENSGSYQDFVKNEKLFVAPIVKWNISPRTQMNFELEYNHDNLGLATQMAPTFNGQFIKIPLSTNYGEPANGLQDTILGSVNWTHQFNDDWSIKNGFTTSQQKTDRQFTLPYSPQLFGTPYPDQITRALWQNNAQNQTYAANIDLTGHFDTAFLKHTLLLGGDYYRTDNALNSLSNTFTYFPGTTYSFININNPVHPGTNTIALGLDPTTGQNFNSHTDQYGIYLQDQIKLPYNFHFTGGLRYQNIHQKAATIYTDGITLPTVAPTQTADAITPRFGLLWQPQNWLSLYSNYAESFGAQAPGTIAYPGKALPPTSAQQWEVGAKTEFFEGRLRTTFAYYNLTKQNIATTDTDQNHAGFCGGICSVAVGEVRSRGPELDIQGEILPGWNVIANYSNIDIIVTRGDPNLYPAVGGRYYGVPRNTARLWNTYEFQQEDLQGFKFGGGVTLRDGQLTNNFSASPFTLPGYATVDLLASYSKKIGKSKITAQLNINNLLDKYYYTSAYFFGGPATTGYDAGYVNFGAEHAK
jgi:iron complex outermembrane receptor protein